MASEYAPFLHFLDRQHIKETHMLNCLFQQEHADSSPLVARRIGFVTIPLACLVLRVVLQTLGILAESVSWPEVYPALSHLPWASVDAQMWWSYLQRYGPDLFFVGIVCMVSFAT